MDKYSADGAVSKRLPRVKDHASDWVEAIRNGREAGSHFGYGGPLTELALLGLIALRFPGQVIEWNGPKASFTNKLAANAWLNPPYRKGWKL